MPGILEAARFNAFDRNAVAVFKTVDLASYRYQRAGGTILYRYVTYNRWTGWGQSANDCARGLYFSNGFLAQDQPFRDPDCFETLSVRDLKSVNSVLRAAPRAPLASVYAKGRATFFVHGGKVGEGVVHTIYHLGDERERDGLTGRNGPGNRTGRTGNRRAQGPRPGPRGHQRSRTGPA